MSSHGVLTAITVVELLLAMVAAQRVFVAVRAYRAERATGLDGWAAAEDGLARVIPRKVARLVVLEPRLYVSLIRWIGRKSDAGGPDSFSYHRGIRPLLLVVIALLVVEGAVADVLVAALLPAGVWVWLVFGMHLYAVVWLLAFQASMVVRPHLVRADGLHVRDGVFGELVIPWSAVRAVRVVLCSNFGRSGFKRDPESAGGVLAVGDATVCLELDPGQPISSPDGLVSLSTLAITVDEPLDFQREVGRRVAKIAHGGTARRHTI